MTEPTARDLYENTSESLATAEGLFFALYELWHAAECVNQATAEAHSIATLMALLRDTVKEASARHSRQWETVRALEAKAEA